MTEPFGRESVLYIVSFLPGCHLEACIRVTFLFYQVHISQIQSFCVLLKCLLKTMFLSTALPCEFLSFHSGVVEVSVFLGWSNYLAINYPLLQHHIPQLHCLVTSPLDFPFSLYVCTQCVHMY